MNRPFVHDLLQLGVQGRVCLLSAGPGWGKTTALAEWADPERTAWLTLTPRDRQPEVLLSHLLAALQPHLPDLAVAAGNPHDTGERFHAALAAQLQTDLVLVLDDAHELSAGSAAGQFIAQLCRHGPRALHLVVCTRDEPPFPVERLRGQGQLTEIDATQLGFDAEEIATLLRATLGDAPSGLATQLATQTDGWPAATCITMQVMRGVRPSQRLEAAAQLTRPGERLHSYVADEVLGRESEQAVAVVHRLAVLGEISLPVARELDIGDTELLLAQLTHRGLTRSRWGRSWRLLRPVRDCLAEQPGADTAQQAEWHRAAADVSARHGAHAPALRHYLAAGEHAAARAVLTAHGAALIGAGEISTVLAAAELPASVLDDPQVQLLIGQARQVGGLWSGAADDVLPDPAEQDELAPGVAWRIGLRHYARGELDQALAICRRARLEREDTADEGQVLAWTAAAHCLAGDYDRCRELATRAVAAAQRCRDSSARAAGYAALALLATAEGDARRTAEYSSVALEAAETADDRVQMAHILALRALGALARGSGRDGLAEAEAALRLSEQCGNRVGRAVALTHRGVARTQLGQLDAALADLTTARDLFETMGSRFVTRPLIGIATVHRLRGRLVPARSAYEEALAAAESGHDLFSLAHALAGLARTRAADDLAVARGLAERAVRVGDGTAHAQCLLGRGWIALLSGDRQGAAADAAAACERAKARRDDAGLAEALELAVLAASVPVEYAGLLDEAVEIWTAAGRPIEQARAGLVLASLRGDPTDGDEQRLREHDVRPRCAHAAGPLAALPRSTPRVSVRALGSFRVFRDGAPVPNAEWRSKKARELVKILVVRRRPVPREQLLELLWPDEESARAANRLSVLLSTVRTVLDAGRDGQGAGHLGSDGSLVWLDGVDVDVEHFLTAARAALDADARGDPDATDALLAAEAHYTGALLEDDPYPEWAMDLGEYVRASYLAVLRALAARLRRDGATDRAVHCTLRLLAEDGYDETAHLALVDTLRHAGHLGEARRHHTSYTRRMSELGVDPQPFAGDQ